MPRAIFERASFVEVGPAGRSRAVLFKPLTDSADVQPPRWVGRISEMTPVQARSQWTSTTPTARGRWLCR
jgi:hypothetical protein